jgi:hypothetical protein
MSQDNQTLSHAAPKASRRAVLTAAPTAAAAALAGGTVANTVALAIPRTDEVAPIFELIERHRAACDAARTIGAAWNELIPSDDETYAAISERFGAAIDREREVLVAVLTCQPTTLAGIVAVLEHVGQMDWVHGDDSDETILVDGHKRKIEEAKAFPKHLAAALRSIIERGQA